MTDQIILITGLFAFQKVKKKPVPQEYDLCDLLKAKPFITENVNRESS